MTDLPSDEIRFIDIGHTQVAHRRLGSGPDVVFVHGWPLQSATWRHVVAALPEYTCHLIDLPGAGASRATRRTPLSLRDHVDSLDAVLDHLHLERFTLVGHDSGGMIARYVAARRPDQVAALVLTGTEIPDHHSLLLRALVSSGRLPGITVLLREALRRPRVRQLPFVFGGCFADVTLLDGDFADQLIHPLLQDPDQLAAQVQGLKAFTFDLVDELSAIHPQLSAPSLLIWGARDPFFPVRHARDMTTQFAGPTRFEVVQDAKLLVHEEHPEQFAALMTSFFHQWVPPSSGWETSAGLG